MPAVSTATTPPGPKHLPFIGALPQFRRMAPSYLEQIAHEYGDIVFVRVGRQRIFFLNHPDLIRDVLVTHQTKFKKSRILEKARIILGDGLLTSEGAFHRQQRRLVQPAFYRDRLVGYGKTMTACASSATDRWQPGQELDMSIEMAHLTLNIVSRTLFSTGIEGQIEQVMQAMEEVLGVFDMILTPFSDLLEKLPLPKVRRFYQAREQLDQIIYRIINERRASGEDTGDLLSMLLLAQNEDEAGEREMANHHRRMTDTQVRDEALTLFVAGHETTANLMTWTWYLLSQNPEVETRLHAELAEVLSGRPPEFVDLPNLPFTDAVIAESLRLYPPGWAIGRRALEDYPVRDTAGNEYVVPARAVVLVSQWVTHRDPRWFPDPLAFRPERWLDAEFTAGLPKFAYFPFGGGTRVCIGERFARMEAVLILATIAQRWRFHTVPGFTPEPRAIITLRTRDGMRMLAEPRA